MVWTVIWWALSGFYGLKKVWDNRLHRTWVVVLLIFGGWTLLSWVWSYKRVSYPSVTIGAAVPVILVLFFVICLSSIKINLRIVFGALIFGLIWNSVLVAAQVALQAPVGLKSLGEFQFNPASSGTVIVQAGEIRWLRPYGLLPHPNMLAGFLVIALFAAIGWIMTSQSKRWTIFVGVFAFGFWCLLLTFSRSAWLSLVVGVMVFGLLTMGTWRRNPHLLIRILVIIGVALIASGLFFWIYQPFLAARAGIGDESVELRSSSDRVVYNQIALDAIKQSPILGTGIGNFPWYAAVYLSKTKFDLKGQPVHNIYLSAWAELGIIGLALYLAAIGFPFMAGIKNIRQAAINQQFLYTAALSGICGLLVIGIFDHYPWTLIQFQVALWGLMAVVIRPPSATNELT